MIQTDKIQVGIGQKVRKIALLPVLGEYRWLNSKLIKHIGGSRGEMHRGKTTQQGDQTTL